MLSPTELKSFKALVHVHEYTLAGQIACLAKWNFKKKFCILRPRTSIINYNGMEKGYKIFANTMF